MMIFGGLQPIPAQLFVDAITIASLCLAVFTPAAGSFRTTSSSTTTGNYEISIAHYVFLVAPYLLVLTTAGLTNRWPLSFPMVPLLLLQLLRLLPIKTWASTLILVLSVLILALSVLLAILFPAVQLPATTTGPYNVGVVDFFLPVDLPTTRSETKTTTNDTCHATADHRLSVRLFYPTLEQPTRLIPYLTPALAVAFCRHSMRFGAPGPLKPHGWFLHTWRLAGLNAKRGAKLMPGMQALPVVIFSHGLGSNTDVYSYQLMALASAGYVVLSVNHRDGSAAVIQNADGSFQTYDYELSTLWNQGLHEEYVRLRRDKTDQRASEFLAATEAFLKLNDNDDNLEPALANISLRGRLETDRVTFMGHSFGGATALAAAQRRPELVTTIVAHDPAVDWMPDDVRRSLLPSSKLEGLSYTYTGGTGGFLSETTKADSNEATVHDLNLLILSSEEWRKLEWGETHILAEMKAAGRFGGKGGISDFQIVANAKHMEFSDVCMLTPLWLARAVGSTGPGNPCDKAALIARLTVQFLEKSR
jgi:pimeloyl-ACP methyl ester carboxylesterase